MKGSRIYIFSRKLCIKPFICEYTWMNDTRYLLPAVKKVDDDTHMPQWLKTIIEEKFKRSCIKASTIKSL